MKIAAIYIRVSTEEQTEFSPDAQLREIRNYAEKNGILINDNFIFKDEGISGRTAEKRPAFQKMIYLAKTKPKPFDVILVHKFDRFSRSREDSIVYKSLLKKECGIRVISVMEHLEDDKYSLLIEAMLEAMAEYYSLNLSEEVKKGMTEKALRGELQTPAPFGYRMIKGLLSPQEDEAKIIQEIFYKYAVEKNNLRTIAKYVNSLGYRSKKGNLFSSRTIEYIIYNPVYIGKIRWTPTGSVVCKHDFDNPDTIVINSKHKGIVDEKIWQKANILIRSRKKIRTPKYHKESEISTHWLRGLLKCASCGTGLSFGKGTKGRQGAFRCNKYLTGACSEPQRITASQIEKIIFSVLTKDCIKNGEYQKLNCDLTGPQTENYLKHIEKLKSQLRKAKEFALAGIDSPDEYKENKSNISNEIEETRKLIEKLQSEQANYLQTKISCILDILASNATLTEKNAAIKEVVKKIVFNKKENCFEIHYCFFDETL